MHAKTRAIPRRKCRNRFRRLDARLNYYTRCRKSLDLYAASRSVCVHSLFRRRRLTVATDCSTLIIRIRDNNISSGYHRARVLYLSFSLSRARARVITKCLRRFRRVLRRCVSIVETNRRGFADTFIRFL